MKRFVRLQIQALWATSESVQPCTQGSRGRALSNDVARRRGRRFPPHPHRSRAKSSRKGRLTAAVTRRPLVLPGVAEFPSAAPTSAFAVLRRRISQYYQVARSSTWLSSRDYWRVT